MIGQSFLQLFSPSYSLIAFSLVSTSVGPSARPASEASVLSTPMPLRRSWLWRGSSHWSCVLPFCERRQRKSACCRLCFAYQSVVDGLATCLVQIEGDSSPGIYFLSHCPSPSISAGLPTSLLSHPAIHPTSLCPFASRYPRSSFLWFFP